MDTRLIQNAIRFRDLDGEWIYLNSTHQHDYQTHRVEDRTYVVDGGLDYQRTSINEDQENWSLHSKSSIKDIRDKLLWGITTDKDGTPLDKIVWKPISNLDSSHLNAILIYFQKAQLNLSPLHKKIIEYWIKQKLNTYVNN